MSAAVPAPTGLFRIFKRFWPQIRSEKKLLAVSFLGLLGEVAMRLLEPWPLKFVIDRVLDPAKSSRSLHGLLSEASAIELISVAAAAVILFGALRALFSYINTVGLALVGNRVLTQIRGDLYRHLQALSLSFHTKQRGGELIVRVINDVGMLKDVTLSAMLPFLTNILMVFGMIGVMFWVDWRLALVALTVLPIFWVRTQTLTRKLRQVSREQRKREGAMAATAAESIGAIKVVKALSLERVFATTFSTQNDKSLNDGAKAARLEANLERTVDVLIAISSGMVIWLGARFVLSGALTAGALVVFLNYLKTAFKPVRDFAKYTGRLAKASAAGERVLNLLDQVPELHDLPTAVPVAEISGALEFERVRFGYEPNHDVLASFNLRVDPGEYVALVGESGAGKSTVASIILRLYDPLDGRLLIDGRDVRDYTIESLRSHISVVLQDTLLFSGTIKENIAFGISDATDQQVQAAAELASAHNFIMSLPAGYATTVGERGVTLSTGQRQRIAIARAAIRQSPILLLDEPTTGLDQENRVAIETALIKLALDRTTLLITHDLTLAPTAHRILFLEKGKIVESGSHDELIEANGRYARLFALQANLRGGLTTRATKRSALIA